MKAVFPSLPLQSQDHTSSDTSSVDSRPRIGHSTSWRIRLTIVRHTTISPLDRLFECLSRHPEGKALLQSRFPAQSGLLSSCGYASVLALVARSWLSALHLDDTHSSNPGKGFAPIDASWMHGNKAIVFV